MTKYLLILSLFVPAALPAQGMAGMSRMHETGTSNKTDSIVAVAKAALAPLKDSVALFKDGYRPIGFGRGVRDLTPFQGQHWVALSRFFANQPVDVSKPEFAMYLPLGDSLIPIGVAYTRRLDPGIAQPTDLAGVPVEWHFHAICAGVPGEGNVIADGVDDCKERGGTATQANIAMVHTWTIPNPDGPYAHDNPALPFVATGLRAPDHASKDDRLLGVALGETYGARLPTAHRITASALREGKNGELKKHRDAIRALVPQLQAAEKAGDTKKFASLRKQTIDEWTALAAEYRMLAPTGEMAARFDVELAQATDGMSHHHM